MLKRQILLKGQIIDFKFWILNELIGKMVKGKMIKGH